MPSWEELNAAAANDLREVDPHAAISRVLVLASLMLTPTVPGCPVSSKRDETGRRVSVPAPILAPDDPVPTLLIMEPDNVQDTSVTATDLYAAMLLMDYRLSVAVGTPSMIGDAVAAETYRQTHATPPNAMFGFKQVGLIGSLTQPEVKDRVKTMRTESRADLARVIFLSTLTTVIIHSQKVGGLMEYSEVHPNLWKGKSPTEVLAGLGYLTDKILSNPTATVQ
jgi:hypothetical protein